MKDSWARPRGAQLLAGYTVFIPPHPLYSRRLWRLYSIVLALRAAAGCGHTDRHATDNDSPASQFFQYPAKSWEFDQFSSPCTSHALDALDGSICILNLAAYLSYRRTDHLVHSCRNANRWRDMSVYGSI